MKFVVAVVAKTVEDNPLLLMSTAVMEKNSCLLNKIAKPKQ